MDNMDIPPVEYSYVFNFEREFIKKDSLTWMTNNWNMAFYFLGIYLVLIFGLQHLMKSRPPFKLQNMLTIWNTGLAVFSIMGACRMIPPFLHTIKHYGWYYTVCIPLAIEEDTVSSLWAWLFMLSKLPELVDTIFIVLRKKPLIFLHWYHHVSVLLFCWFCYKEAGSRARWFIMMNYTVHALMYSYYALRSRGYFLPKPLAMSITMLQIIQMIIGSIVAGLAYYNYLIGDLSCNITSPTLNISLSLYVSYLILFAHFFVQSYLRSPAKHTKKLSGAMPTDNHLHKSKVH